MTLGRNELLTPVRRMYQNVETPIGTVRIQSVSERERSQFEQDTLDRNGRVTKRGMMTVKPRLIIMCAVDGDGQKIFTSADIEGLMELDSITSNLIADACQKLCGITETDLEDLEKNSETHPEDDSPTD